MRCSPWVAVLHLVVDLLRLSVDFFEKLAPQGLLLHFAWIQMTLEQPQAARSNDPGDVIAQLQEPATIALKPR
jgi:hypothetical protein